MTSLVALSLALGISGACESARPQELRLLKRFSIDLGQSVKGKPCRIHSAGGDLVLLECRGRTLGELSVWGINAKNGDVLWMLNIGRHLGLGKDENYEEDTRGLVFAVTHLNDDLVRIFAQGGQGYPVFNESGLHAVDFNPANGKVNSRFFSEFCMLDSWRVPIDRGKVLIPAGGQFLLKGFKDGREIEDFDTTGKHLPTSAALSPDGRWAGGTGDTAWVWDIKSGRRLNDHYFPGRKVIEAWRPKGGYAPSACAFSKDGNLFAVGTRGGSLLVFDVKSGEMRRFVDNQTSDARRPRWISEVYFIGDSDDVLVLYGGGLNPISVYRVATGEWESGALNAQLLKELGLKFLKTYDVFAYDNGRIFVFEESGILTRFDLRHDDN